MATLTFRALQLANEQRNAYGLRYNDHTRYRKHCANRTHRLRSTLKLTHGKGKEFKKLPPLTPEHTKDGHLELLLFEAERAWAYSQDLLAQSRVPANDDRASTLRHSATGRFRRAINWSTQLLSLCQTLYNQSRLSVECLLQATVYTLILNGRFLRYRDEFDDALIQLAVARGLLDELAARATTSRDQALASLFADEIGPEIRHCAHELGDSKSYEVDAIVGRITGQHRDEIVEGGTALIAQFQKDAEALERGEGRKKLQPLTWEGQHVPVRNPELVDVLLKVQQAEAKITESYKDTSGAPRVNKGKKGVAAFDAVLLALSDAEDVARKLLEAQQASGILGSSGAGTRDILFVHAYIVYQLLSRRTQRDLLLVSTLLNAHSATPKTPRGSPPKHKKEQIDVRVYPAAVKVLDTIVQNLIQMRELTIVDESPDLASAMEARLLFTKARRCLRLAQCYVAVKKYAEALTLIQHGNIHLRETRSVLGTLIEDPISNTPPVFYALSKLDVDELEALFTEEASSYKKDWFAYNGGKLEGDSRTHKKPLFFDIALNYVQLDMERLQGRAGKAPMPSQATVQPSGAPKQPEPEKKVQAPIKSRLEEQERPETPEPVAPARGGLSSLLGGWWGRK